MSLENYSIKLYKNRQSRFSIKDVSSEVKELLDEDFEKLWKIYSIEKLLEGYWFQGDHICLLPLDEINLNLSTDFFEKKSLRIGDFASGGIALLVLDKIPYIEIWDFNRESSFVVFEKVFLKDFMRDVVTMEEYKLSRISKEVAKQRGQTWDRPMIYNLIKSVMFWSKK